MMQTRREIAGISDTMLNIPCLTECAISSGLAVTFELIAEISKSTIIYINIINDVLIALPNLFTKLETAEPIPVSLLPVFHSI